MSARAVVDRVAVITQEDVERLASYGMEDLAEREAEELFKLLFNRWDLRQAHHRT